MKIAGRIYGKSSQFLKSKIKMKETHWSEPINEVISIPDELDKLYNKIGMQINFMNISGKNETQTIVDIMAITQKFFRENPELLNI